MNRSLAAHTTTALQYLLIATAFLLPLFFVPVTQDWFEFNKQMLVVSVTLVGYLLWAAKLAAQGEVRLIRTRLDLPFLALSAAVLIAVFVAPSRAVSLIAMETWMLIVMPFLYVLYVNNIPTKKAVWYTFLALLASSTLLSLFTLYSQSIAIGLWSPPAGAGPFSTATFTPAGSMINTNALQIATLVLAGFLAFTVRKSAYKIGFFAAALIAIVALLLHNPFSAADTPLLLSFSESWQIAVESIKQSPLVGSGPGKYVESFMQFRSVSFNEIEEWAVAFASASNAPLHIITELGLLGLVALLAIIGAVLMSVRSVVQYKAADATSETTSSLPVREALAIGVVVATLLLIIFPLTTTILYLFVVLTALFAKQQFLQTKKEGQEVQVWVLTLPVPTTTQERELADRMSSNKTLAQVLFALVGVGVLLSLYGLGRLYAAEMAFHDSLQQAVQQNGTETYRLQQKAIERNPHDPRFHVAYANTNLSIANALAARNGGNLTDEDSRNIGVLINQAVREARRAVTLAPNNAGYWENMGNIYRDLRGVADGADRWAITSYSQAAKLNPNNPRIRVELGGIYYSVEDYDNALAAFQDAIRLKGDYANAYYNLAWTFRRQEKLPEAILAMERVLNLTDATTDDYFKAQTELDEFRLYAQQLGQEEFAQTQAQDVLGAETQQEATPAAIPEAIDPLSAPAADQEESTSAAEGE